MHRFFFCEIFRFLYNSFFIVNPRITASDSIEYLYILTIIEDIRKCLNILSIFFDFIENIWNFSVAMKRSETVFRASYFVGKLFHSKIFM